MNAKRDLIYQKDICRGISSPKYQAVEVQGGEDP